MTCGLFSILHIVLCVLAIDPGTSTECTETLVCDEPGRYTRKSIGGWKCQLSNTRISHKELNHLLSVTLSLVKRVIKSQEP